MAELNNETAANKELVLRFIKLAQAGEIAQMAECLVEDYVQVFPRPGVAGMPAGAESRAQIVEFLSHLSSIYQPGSMEMEVENILAEGSLVAVQFKMKAVTARGEPYENYYVQFAQCREGKIVKCWEYCDTLYAANKLMPKA